MFVSKLRKESGVIEIWWTTFFEENTKFREKRLSISWLMWKFLRYVLLSWRSVNVPHHTLHHPFNSLVHSFAKEMRYTGKIKTQNQGS